MAIPYEKIVLEDLQIGVGSLPVTMPAGGSASGTKIGLHTWNGLYNVQDFGAVGDAVTDDTQAFKDAIAMAIATSHTGLWIPAGEYVITDRLVIPEGIALIGCGTRGSTEFQGSVIKHASTLDCFVFDGSGAAFYGTGGQVIDLLIVKAGGFAGGAAIKIIAGGNNNRPGEMIIDNVLVYGLQNTGLWDYCLWIDGTACNDFGSRGVRSVLVHKFRCADCRTSGKYVYLNQVTHFFTTYLQTDIGSSAGFGADPGITFDGNCENILLAGFNCSGTLTINASPSGDTTNLSLTGRVGTLVNHHPGLLGVASIITSVGPNQNVSPFLRVVSELAPAFHAYNTTEHANLTGDGTFATLTYDVEGYDYSHEFTASTGIFQSQCAGRYHFDVGVLFHNLGVAHTSGQVILAHLDSLGSTKGAYSTNSNLAAMAAPGGNASESLSVLLDLAQNDQVKVQVAVSGGTKTVSVLATPATFYTWFSGRLVP